MNSSDHDCTNALIFTEEEIKDLELPLLPDEDYENYCPFSETLNKLEEQYKENGDLPKARIVRLLNAVISTTFSEKIDKEIYISSFQIGSAKGASQNSFTPIDLDNLELSLPYIKDPMLKGKVFDLLWLKREKKNINNAINAAKEFIKIEVNADNWFQYGKYIFRRVAQLTNNKNTSLLDIRKILEEKFFNLLFADNTQEIKRLSFNIIELVDELKLLKNKYHEINQILRDRIVELKKENEAPYIVKLYYLSLIKRYKTSNQINEENSIKIEMALYLSYDAINSQNLDALRRNTFLNQALVHLREIPNLYRTVQIKDTITEVEKAIQSNAPNMSEMLRPVSGEKIDISVHIEASKNHVRNKTNLNEALLFFSGILPKLNKERLIEIVKPQANSLHRALFSSIALSPSGRVIAKDNPLSHEDIIKDDVLENEALTLLSNAYHFYIQAAIYPAFCEIRETFAHDISLEFFISLCQESIIIPKDRVKTIALGLYHGMNDDFISAVHILSPQLENLIRVFLKNNNIKTVTIDESGIEMEVGLSSLLDKPEINNIFDEDFIFEIKALMTSQKGPNLRNNIAHGLYDDDFLDSSASVYLWWRFLKLIVMGNVFILDDDSSL